MTPWPRILKNAVSFGCKAKTDHFIIFIIFKDPITRWIREGILFIKDCALYIIININYNQQKAMQSIAWFRILITFSRPTCRSWLKKTSHLLEMSGIRRSKQKTIERLKYNSLYQQTMSEKKIPMTSWPISTSHSKKKNPTFSLIVIWKKCIRLLLETLVHVQHTA